MVHNGYEDDPVGSAPWCPRRGDPPRPVTNAIRLVDTDDGVFVIGADASGQMLELVARPTEDGDLVVFHAMPLRPVNAKRYLS